MRFSAVRRALPGALFLAVSLTLGQGAARAQFNIPKPPRIPGVPSADRIPGLDKLLKEEEPLTTDLRDSFAAVPFLDDFDPAVVAQLAELPLGNNEEFLYLPGLYEIFAETYCLKAGTWAPLPGQRNYEGNGYLYAPYKGPKAGIIQKLVNARMDHPEVPQGDVQQLLWAIIARAKLSDCPAHLQRVARRLLSDRDLRALDDSVLGPLPPEVREKAYANLPPFVRTALEAENRLREELRAQVSAAVQPVDAAAGRVNDATSTANAAVEGRSSELYRRMESIAVLTGEPPSLDPKDQIPWGRWTYHPDGYFVRCLVQWYGSTRRQVYHPERFAIKNDAQGRVASLTAPGGESIEFTYDGGGQTLRSVRLVRPNYGAKDGAPIVATVSGAAGDGQGRNYERLWKDAEGVLRKQHSTFGKVGGAGGLEANLRDLARLRYAVQALLKADPKAAEEGNAWWKGHADLVTRAWMSAMARYVSGDRVVALGVLPRPERGGGLRPVAAGAAARQGGWGGFSGGGGGGFSGGGGGGAGMPGPGRQRIAQSNKKQPNPNLDRARKAEKALNWGVDKSKFVSNTGLGIPWRLANWLVNWQFDMTQKIDDALNGDPPRPDFNTYARPNRRTLPRVPADVKTDAELKAGFEAMIDSLEDVRANLYAGMESVDKHGGARKAGDAKWTFGQACAVTHYKREAGKAMVAAADRIDAYRKLLAKKNVTDEADSAQQAQAYIQRLKTSGFTPEEIEAAKAIGMSDADIEASRKERIAAGVSSVAYKNVQESLEEAASQLRAEGEYYLLLPPLSLPEDNGSPALVTRR